MLLSLAAMTRAEAEGWTAQFDAFAGTGDDAADARRWDELTGVFTEPSGVDLEKAWDMVSEILNPEFGDVFFTVGAEAIGTTEDGYGPPLFASGDVVARVQARLAELDDTEVARRYDAILAAGRSPYPGIWHRADEAAENRQWAIDATASALAIYRRAARLGCGVLSVML